MRPLSESSTFTRTLNVPEDGDDADAASVNEAFQGLTDRTRYLFDLLPNGLILGSLRLRHTPEYDGVVLAPIAGLWLNGRVFREPAPSVIRADRAETPGFTGAATEVRWWFLYAFEQSNRLAFEYSRTPPDASLVFKAATQTHRYLGTVFSWARNTVLGFAACNGRYQLEVPREFAAAERAPRPRVTSLARNEVIAAHIRRVSLDATLENGNDFATISLYVRNFASELSDADRAVLSVPARQARNGSFDVALNEQREFRWYTTDDRGPGHPVSFRLLGFDEG